MSDSILEIVDALRSYAQWQSVMRRSTSDQGVRPEQAFIDRRAHVRHRPVQLDRPMLARLKPGPLLTLLDVSEGGALIQTPARLTPGAHIHLEFLAPATRQTVVVRSRVTRSHVSALEGYVRYRGACSFDEVLQLADFLPRDRHSGGLRPPTNLQVRGLLAGIPMNAHASGATATDAVVAIRQLLGNAPGLHAPAVARLLDEMQRMTAAHASDAALLRTVEAWLRSEVPLLALRVSRRSADTLRAGDLVSFKLPVPNGDGPSRIVIEFRPACGLDDSQVRLLEAAACVMSMLCTAA